MSCHPFSDESDRDICPKCGQWFANHNDDGSCVAIEVEVYFDDHPPRCCVCSCILRTEEVSLCCDCNEALCRPLSTRESY